MIDVAALTSLEAYQQGGRAFLDGIRRTPPAPAFDAVLVPGDFEHRSRAQRLAHGVEVPDTIYRQIEECAGKLDVALGEDAVGVSKFSKVSLFSGLNNLTDLTLDPRYAAICGYTKENLDTVFAAELPGLDREQIRDRYNGYNWRGSERIYNPYDVLRLFHSREFDAHWFETGSPTFLVKTLFERRVTSVSLGGDGEHRGAAVGVRRRRRLRR